MLTRKEFSPCLWILVPKTLLIFNLTVHVGSIFRLIFKTNMFYIVSEAVNNYVYLLLKIQAGFVTTSISGMIGILSFCRCCFSVRIIIRNKQQLCLLHSANEPTTQSQCRFQIVAFHALFNKFCKDIITIMYSQLRN